MSEVRFNAPQNHLTKARLPRWSGGMRRGLYQRGESDDDLSRLRTGIAFRANEGPYAAAQSVFVDRRVGERACNHRAKVVGVGNVC
jgi:hypothetical protein